MKYVISIVLILLVIVLYLLYYLLCLINNYTYDTSSYCEKLRLIKENNYPSKKILIVTLETRKSDMLNIHNANINNYCKDKGYDYIFLDNYENELDLPIYWKKIQVMKDLLTNYKVYDYIMWMDSDTLILDPDIKIDNILKDKSIYIGKDYQLYDLNAGVFIIKNDNIGNMFIEDCIKTYINREECKDNNGKYSLNSEWSGKCYEQGIMIELIKTKYEKNTTILEPYIIWNWNSPVSNVFILHLWGGKGNNQNKREYAFKKLAKNNKYYESRIEQLIYQKIL